MTEIWGSRGASKRLKPRIYSQYQSVEEKESAYRQRRKDPVDPLRFLLAVFLSRLILIRVGSLTDGRIELLAE